MLVGFQGISQGGHKNVVCSVQFTEYYLCGQQNCFFCVHVLPGDGRQSNQSERSERRMALVNDL